MKEEGGWEREEPDHGPGDAAGREGGSQGAPGREAEPPGRSLVWFKANMEEA